MFKKIGFYHYLSFSHQLSHSNSHDLMASTSLSISQPIVGVPNKFLKNFSFNTHTYTLLAKQGNLTQNSLNSAIATLLTKHTFGQTRIAYFVNNILLQSHEYQYRIRLIIKVQNKIPIHPNRIHTNSKIKAKNSTPKPQDTFN